MPFLNFDTEIRRIICTTNAIESVNARIRRAFQGRGHFPNAQAALKCVYLAVMALDPTCSPLVWKNMAHLPVPSDRGRPAGVTHPADARQAPSPHCHHERTVPVADATE